MTTALTIGDVARRTDVAATTLRYYEKIGLLPMPLRAGGQRRYDGAVLTRLEVIGLCKAAGFSLDEIAVLLRDDAPGRPASRALAEAKLADIDAQLATLARLRHHRVGDGLHVSVVDRHLHVWHSLHRGETMTDATPNESRTSAPGSTGRRSTCTATHPIRLTYRRRPAWPPVS